MKFIILEKTYTFTQYLGDQYVIYINPTPNELSAANETKHNRGIIDENGDLYVEARIIDSNIEDYGGHRNEEYSNLMHVNMINILRKENKTLFQGIDSFTPWGHNKWFLSKMVCVSRDEDTNKFGLSEIYEINVPSNTPLIMKAKKKNPSLKLYGHDTPGLRQTHQPVI